MKASEMLSFCWAIQPPNTFSYSSPFTQCTLEFELRLQEYIELARARKTLEGIAYTRKYLVSWQETHIAQIQQASALLAIHPSTTCGPYKVSCLPMWLACCGAQFYIHPRLYVPSRGFLLQRLYDPCRWKTLILDFRRAIYTLNMLPTEPLLNLALYAGLASLKLPACYDQATKNVDCPVCDGDSSGSEFSGLGLGALAEEVPFSHHVNSTIVCRISGRIMDEDNMPMAFPDGHVYSREVSARQSILWHSGN